MALGALATGVAPVALTTLAGRTGVDRWSVSVYFIPVVVAVLGWTVLGEDLTPPAIAGTALVLAGAWLAGRGGTKRD